MEAKMMLWLVVATCIWWNSKSRSQIPTFLRHAVNETTCCNQRTGNSVRITGPNGYCVTVKDDDYKDGNDVILLPCEYSSEVNQIWSFENDGTVRSKGMCLTCYGWLNQGTRISIYSCNEGYIGDKIWQVRDINGQIVNSESGLVLSAISGKPGTTLTIETNIFSSSQTWRFDNVEWQPEQQWWIIGLNRMCLFVSKAVWMQECSTRSTEKVWLYFPDKTIRPWLHPKVCLSYDNLTDKRVIVVTCGLGPTNERWLLTSRGTILNEGVNLVIEVRDPKDIILAPATELPNQIWDIAEPRMELLSG